MERPTGPAAAIGSWTLLFGATLIAYLPALRGGLLWDDDHHVTSPELQSLHGLWRIWFDVGATQQYYPLLHSAFWLEHKLWGDAVLGYHLLNVILHITAACLVIAIARRLLLAGATLAGLVFALHPVSVESVAWISEQKTTLSAVLCLGAALVYLHFDRSRRLRHYIQATALFVLALLAKTVTATLPAALLVIFWWKRGRLEWKRDVRPLLPWFALGAAAGTFTTWLEKSSIGAQGADFALTLTERFLVAGRVIWFYAGKLIWPAGLTFTYPRWTVDAGAWSQYLFPAAVVALTIALWRIARRHRGPLAGFLIFAGTLFPVLGFLNVYPFIFSFVADHFQYLASLGVIIPAACGLTLATRRISPRVSRVPSICAAALLLAVLGSLTWRQSRMYRDSETLYRITLAHNPSSWMARNNLCAMLSGRIGGLEEAVAQCEAALRLRPDYAEAHNNLGSAWAQAGRMPDAIAEFRAALGLKPQFAEAHFNLANALAQIPGTAGEAIAEYEAALRIRPAYLEARTNLATVLSRTPGRLAEAVAQYQAALRIDPRLTEAHNNLGTALAQIPGRLPDAIVEYRAALEVNPNYAKAHNNLGSALAELPGRLTDAIAEYQAAVRSNPEYADAHYNLALALSRAGRTPEAIAEFEAVLHIEPGSAKTHYNLGVILARENGRMPEALAQFEAALAIHPDPGLRRTVDAMRAVKH